MMEVVFYVRMELKFTSSREALKVELSSGTDPNKRAMALQTCGDMGQ